MHTHNKGIVEKAYALIHGTPEFIRLEYATQAVLDRAWEKWMQFARWPEKPLSFTDCCLLSFMERNDIESLATFDSDFSGLCSTVAIRP